MCLEENSEITMKRRKEMKQIEDEGQDEGGREDE